MITMEKLKFLRLQRGLSQEELAKMIHIAPNTLSDYENGKVIPNMEIFQKILLVLRYDLSLTEINKDDFYSKNVSNYEKNRKPDIAIYYDSYNDFLYEQKKSIEEGEISSLWEFVSYVKKGESEVFLHNEVLSKEGLVYTRVYKNESVILKRIEIDKKGKPIITDKWATLLDFKKYPYLYIKHKAQLEKRISYLDESETNDILTELGREMFSKRIFEKHFLNFGGVI